jgi:hypothetical protein
MDCKKIKLQVKFDPTAIKWWAEYLLSNSLVPSIEQLRHSTLILPFQSTNIIKTLQQNHDNFHGEFLVSWEGDPLVPINEIKV